MAWQVATLGGGCFWCIEAAFHQLKGVHQVVSGYMGGQLAAPTYRDICRGDTGHAEVVQIQFDPEQISYSDLLTVFFFLHDPTQLNRQGNDVGTQYRSVIFFHSSEQQQAATLVCQQLQNSGQFSQPIVTEISAASQFYPAEDYHQGYVKNHPEQPYCQFLVLPKLAKFSQQFRAWLNTTT